MRYWQNSEAVFQKKICSSIATEKSEYPEVRKITVELYGGNAEEAIARCRKELGLDEGWELVGYSAPNLT